MHTTHSNCYLSRNYRNRSSAGSKAKSDMERLMEQEGFRNVGLPRTYYENHVLAFFLTLLGVLKSVWSIRRGDRLFLQYPLKKYFVFVCRVAHWKRAQVVVLIHDLGSFRRKALTIPQEINRLNHADYLIALNPSMQRWLREHGCTLPVGTLGIWDYLSEATGKAISLRAPHSPLIVVYAGALSRRKNAFLYQWGAEIRGYRVNIYGRGFDADRAAGREHFCMKGFVESDRLIASVEGDFGLVWDGDSTATCSGNFGEYLQYNNPHKTSLYIRCGLPVIVWSKAALAPFVLRHGIGLCIDSLAELNERLPAVTPEAYRQLKENVEQMSRRMACGYYFKQAVRELNFEL